MCKIKFIVLILVLVSFSTGAQNIQLVFRYDDFRLQSNKFNEELVLLFQNHKVPLVLGVIPCDSNEKLVLEKKYNFLPLLKKGIQNQSIEIALHGLNHLKFFNGEFGNLKQEEQYRRMSKGKVLLDSIFNTQIATFIPPWNWYDAQTLNVMSKIGLKGISSRLNGDQPFTNSAISYFPQTIEDFGLVTSVLEHNRNRNVVVVIMFHSYTFIKGYTLNDLDNLLTLINKMKHVKCLSFLQLYNEGEISDEKRMTSNLDRNLLNKYLHFKGAIQSTNYAITVRILNLIMLLAWCSFIFFISYYLFFRRSNNLKKQHFLLLIFLLFLLGIADWFYLLPLIKLPFIFSVVSALLPFIITIKFKK